MTDDRLPPLNAVRAFESAARHLSFTKAAEELQVTPGAISQQIRLLEEYVGTTMFRRTGRSVLLTDAGQAALPILREAFEKLSEATRIMKEPQRKGKVMISVAPSLAVKWLAPRLDRFQIGHPDIDVWMSSDMNLVEFSGGQADMAIRYGGGNYDGLQAEKLMDETVLPVCSPELLKGSYPIKTPKDLLKHTLLHDMSPDHDPSCPDWVSWLTARGVAIPQSEKTGSGSLRGPRFNQGSLAIEAAAAGRGVALAKRAIAEADLASGRLIAPFADGSVQIDFSYWIVWPRGRTQSEELQTFKKWLRSEASMSEVGGV